MNDQLPWGWLVAAPELVTPAEVERDAALIAGTVAFHAIVAHWDDVVPCAVKTADGYTPTTCDRPAYWMYHCPCGRPITVCTPHKVMADEWTKIGDGACHLCHSDFPNPIPWLPL